MLIKNVMRALSHLKSSRGKLESRASGQCRALRETMVIKCRMYNLKLDKSLNSTVRMQALQNTTTNEIIEYMTQFRRR